MTGTERLLIELMVVSFVISTAMVVLGAASSASAGGSAPARVPAWFFNLGFVWSYLSVLVSVYLLALATNNLSGKWRPILITLLCAFPIFLLWLFCIALLIALLS